MPNSSASQKFTWVSGMLALSSPLIVEVTGFHTGMEKYHDNAGKNNQDIPKETHSFNSMH